MPEVTSWPCSPGRILGYLEAGILGYLEAAILGYLEAGIRGQAADCLQTSVINPASHHRQ